MSSSPMNFVTAAQAERMLKGKMRKIMGFARKRVPDLAALKRPVMYIFNISDQEVTWRDPGFPRMVVKACEPGKPYSDALPIMEMYSEEYLGSADSTELNWYNGIEIAYSILRTGPGIPASLDLRRQGLFLSETNPPKQSEVEAARTQLNETMRKLLHEGDVAVAGGNLKDINELHRRASAYLKQPRDWNRDHIAMINCPECGQPVSELASIHFGPGACGAVLNWDRAIASGLKKDSDRPVPVAVGLNIKEKK